MADIISSFFSLDTMKKQHEMLEIVKTNEKASEYNLKLTNAQALEIIETKNHILKSYGRIEVGTTIINKLINAFCSSPFINQKDYASIINELVETFYYLKNETLETVSDDELIDLMKDFFDSSCRGSIELLQGRELEAFARNMRFGLSQSQAINPDYGEDSSVDDSFFNSEINLYYDFDSDDEV